MTSTNPPTLFILILTIFSLITPLHALGSASTIAAVSSTRTNCGILAGEPTRQIQCFSDGRSFLIQPKINYDSIAGGRNFFCALRSDGTTLLCFDTTQNRGSLRPKRIYFNTTRTLREISVGDDQVCAIVNNTNRIKCWRGMKRSIQSPISPNEFRSVSSGLGFSCGVLISGEVKCWGSNSTFANEIEEQFINSSLSTIFSGAHHVCGFNSSGNETLICRGSNSSGQLNPPIDESFTQLALGFDFTCGIRKSNRTVSCWGGEGRYTGDSLKEISFELITAGSDFVCGLTSASLSVICWGPGWINNTLSSLPLSVILPGKCVRSSCECGTYPESEILCSNSGQICSSCDSVSAIPPSSSSSSFSPARSLSKSLLALVIIGSIGVFIGICSVAYFFYIGDWCGRRKVHNSVQPQITRGGSNNARFSSNSPPSRSSTIRRQCSRVMRRQRSGTSSTKNHDRAEEFTFSDLAAATENFSAENKIGGGSFGVVYKGKLVDGREVAIKRGETNPKAKKFQEKETAFDSELLFLSRLHHKHLVRLFGFCQERDERLLVYEYMKNGALYDHLHKDCSSMSSWKLRIRIALDASRGIEYLHNYAVPPIIHRDIKSSNILLDSSWTARVSDFGLSLMGPEENEHDFRPSKAAGTVGYIDPEYYGLNVLTTKSDVYGLGVVLLELLTGKRAIFKGEESGGVPTSVVDFAVPVIMAGEVARILDKRAASPGLNESEAVELVAYTAMHCVSLEGKDRPTISDIVANLERALALCDDSHGSISSVSLGSG